jgi:hypothetical protein
LSIALYDAETWTLRKVDRKYLERFGAGEDHLYDSVINARVLQRVKRERNVLPTTKKEKVN